MLFYNVIYKISLYEIIFKKIECFKMIYFFYFKIVIFMKVYLKEYLKVNCLKIVRLKKNKKFMNNFYF